jgi:hypothetical protein
VATIDINAISSAIVTQKAPWTAVHTPLLDLPDDALHARLGVNVDQARLKAITTAAAPNIAQIIAHFESLLKIGPVPQQASAKAAAPAATTKLPAATTAAVKSVQTRLNTLQIVHPAPVHIWPFPIPVDWRNRRGRNNVTPVKDQGGCGSCVSFGTTGTLESMVLVEHNLSTDLSEAELIFCGGGSCGGWWPDPAITYLKNSGLAQESCFPYQAHNMPCNTCADRPGEAIQVTNSVILNDIAQRKQYLYNVGPMIAVFAVYDDFFGYQTGVYKHVTGGLAGYHCVECIGYDDFSGSWICKNSWSTGWGNGGFFNIAYGECGIDTQFPFWGVYGIKWLLP